MDLNLKSVGALTAAGQGVSGVFVAWRDDGGRSMERLSREGKNESRQQSFCRAQRRRGRFRDVDQIRSDLNLRSRSRSESRLLVQGQGRKRACMVTTP